MANGVKRCLALLAKVAQSDGEAFLLNRRQCHHLALTCVSWLEPVCLPSLPPRLLRELHATLHEILAFFASCREPLWLSSLATRLDPHEAFLLHLKSFMLCMATALAISLHHSNASPFVDCFIQFMSNCDKAMSPSELNAHLLADRHSMLQLLQYVAQGGSTFREKHEDQTNPVVKMKCFNFSSSTRRRPHFLQRERRCLAAFLAKKSNEMVSLSATPHTVPRAFCIDSSEIHIVGRNRLGEEGHCSKVFDGSWHQHRVAVKVFSKEDQTFIHETSMIAGLSNPYIVKLIGWANVEAQRSYWLVMERMCEGLHTYMAKNSPSLEVKVDIMLQISRGMEYLHGMKVMHRDLKPSNVLVRPCEHKKGHLRIKVSDFGVAKFKPIMPLYSTASQGTSYYRAPEVLQYGGSDVVNVVFKKYTLRADVFSFAILCFEILAERTPECFLCTPKEYYSRVTNNVRPSLPECCPTLLLRCIERCWHIEPSRRPSFVDITKVLVYMKSAMMVFCNPKVAGISAKLSDFVNEDIYAEEG